MPFTTTSVIISCFAPFKIVGLLKKACLELIIKDTKLTKVKIHKSNQQILVPCMVRMYYVYLFKKLINLTRSDYIMIVIVILFMCCSRFEKFLMFLTTA